MICSISLLNRDSFFKYAGKIHVLLLLSFFISNYALAFGNNCVEGNHVIKSVSHTLQPFDAISVKGAFEVFVKSGKDFNVKIIAESNLIPYIITETKDSSLLVYTSRSVCTNDVLKIIIECPKLKKLRAEGSNDISVMGLNTEKFSLELGGATDLKIEGRARDASFKLCGAGDLDASDFKVNNLMIRLSGSGDAEVWAEDNLNVVIEGTGTVSYKGNPTVIKKIVGGIGSLEHL